MITLTLDHIDPKELYSSKDAAELVGWATYRIFKRVQDGKIPSMLIGHARMIRGQALRDWIMEELLGLFPELPLQVDNN